ncbi:MAG TPA: phosphoadenylyl-sulfate reductase [Bryobacteraceae bacterium]|nr:phosphoadenylyl-sulfate reductase [Bryobacteraceae bacterium]
MEPVAASREIIAAAIAEFGSSLAVLSSLQREDVIVTDLVLEAAPRTRVLTLDTGRVPPSTEKIIADIEGRYGIKVERIAPDTHEVEGMVALHGRDLFRDSVPNRMLCCEIRKSRPLALGLKGIPAFFTGLRRAQAKSRANIDIFDRSGASVKISPLADWTTDDVIRYTLERGLPEHPLYAAGYTSIGCDPCTRPVVAGEDERAGRWWWESPEAVKECGLHFSADGKAERVVDVLLREVLNRHTGQTSA